jgi:hypothetical protein
LAGLDIPSLLKLGFSIAVFLTVKETTVLPIYTAEVYSSSKGKYSFRRTNVPNFDLLSSI